MKYPMLLQAASSKQAQRNHLSTNEKKELSERGKLETWRGLSPDETVVGKVKANREYL